MLSCPECGVMLAQIFDMGAGSMGSEGWEHSQRYLCTQCGRVCLFKQGARGSGSFISLDIIEPPRTKIADKFWWSHGVLMYGANYWEEFEVIDVPVDVFSKKIRERRIQAIEPGKEPFVINEPRQ